MTNKQNELYQSFEDDDTRIIESLGGASEADNKADSQENREAELLIGANIQFVKDICASLNRPSNEYTTEETLRIIVNFLNSGKKLPRIFYSEISSNIFEIQQVSKGNDPILTNMDELLKSTIDQCRFNKSNMNQNFSEKEFHPDEVEKFVIRLFDHIHLAELQINHIAMARKSSEEAKKTTHNYEKRVNILAKRLEKAQQEYISVLGIFATVVVTFMGGLTFSSSVLQTMQNVSTYRLIGIIALLGFIVFNLINMLMKFLLITTDKMNRKELGQGIFRINFQRWQNFTFVEKINFSFFVILLLDIFAWMVDLTVIRHYWSLKILNFLNLH